jgi:hypothetical protein
MRWLEKKGSVLKIGTRFSGEMVAVKLRRWRRNIVVLSQRTILCMTLTMMVLAGMKHGLHTGFGGIDGGCNCLIVLLVLWLSGEAR